jgi:flagellar protein FlaJ
MRIQETFAKLRKLFSQKNTPQKEKKQAGKDFEKLNDTAYQVVGEKIGRALPIFKDLDTNLQRAGMKISFKGYVSLTVFSTLIATISVAVFIPVVLGFIFNVPLLAAVLFGVGLGLLAGATSVICFYSYPIYRADKHKREIDDELPFTTGYMAILANAGLSIEKIFQALAALRDPLAASSEAKDVIRHINLFGMDAISALEKTANRTPSEKLKEIIEGIIATTHSGGNLPAYLRERFRNYIKIRKLNLKKYNDTLSILSETYVIMLLTAPLLFVIMLSVMSVLGGNIFGDISSDLLLRIVTYVAIPVCATVFLIIVDAVSPKW